MDLLRAGIVLGILAVGVLVVLISGGIDVSTTSLAIVALYVTTLFVQRLRARDGLAPGLPARHSGRGACSGPSTGC